VSFPLDKPVIDHNDEKTLGIVLSEGAWAAISTCFDKLTPREVALIIKELLERNEELDRVIVNSEYGWGISKVFLSAANSLRGKTARHKKKRNRENNI